MNANVEKNAKLMSLEGYNIVIPAGSDESVVELIAHEAKELFAAWGTTVEVVSDNTPKQSREIRIGKTNRTQSTAPDKLCYEIAAEPDGAVRILASSAYGYDEALSYIKEQGGIPADVYQRANAADALPAYKTSQIADSVRAIYYNIFLFGDYNGNRTETGGSFLLRAELLKDTFDAYSADVLALQEYRDNRTYPNGVKPSAYMAEKLAEIGYDEVNVDDLVFASGDDRNDTPIYYKRSTVKPIERGYLLYPRFMNEKYEVDENGTIPINNYDTKSLTWAVFEVMATGQRFAAMSTHLMYPAHDMGLTPEQHNRARVIDAGLALEIIQDIKKMKGGIYADIPILLGGDMNTFPDTEPMFVLRDGGMRMARDMAKQTPDAVFDTYGGKGYCRYDYERKVYTRIPEVAKTDTGYDHVLFDNADNAKLCKYLTLTDRVSRIPSDHPVKLVEFSFR